MEERQQTQLPPHSTDAERSVLGGMLIEANALELAIEQLHEEDFYLPTHQAIFAAMRDIRNAGGAVDLVTLSNELERHGKLDMVGGPLYLSELMSFVPTAVNTQEYISIVEEKSVRRLLIRAGGDIARDAQNDGGELEDALNGAERRIYDITMRKSADTLRPIEQVVPEAFNEISELMERKGTITGVSTGFTELNRMTNGFQKSDLIIIAARPAMGKTAFVLSMAKNMAVNSQVPVALFSLEMSNVQLVNRLIVNVCEIPGDKIKSGQLAPYEWGQLDYKIKELYDAPLYVDDTPSLSVFELRTKARRLVREHGVRIIIIDYLQLMNASGMSFGSRQEEVSTISRSLKGLAKELNIPIIALSQLNRGVESREGIEGKRPQLSDLRESGAIEQDADMVLFVHRPEYYHIYEDENGRDLHGMAQIIIAKHRKGATGDVLLTFRGEFTRFENPEDTRLGKSTPAAGGEILGSRINGDLGPAPELPNDYDPFGGMLPPGEGPAF